MLPNIRPAIALANESHGVLCSKRDECEEHKQTKILTFSSFQPFQQILRGKCLSHLDHCVIYTGMDMETGEMFTVKEFSFIGDEKANKKTSRYLTELIQLHHCNLAEIKNFKCEKITQNEWLYYVLQEFAIDSTSLSLLLTKHIPIPTGMLRHIASGVLHAVEYLISNGVLDFNLTASTIYVDMQGGVKITDFGINKPLLLTLDDCDRIIEANIYNIGILLTSLLKGKVLKNDEIKVSNINPDALREFLTGCMTKRKQERLTVVQLLNHPFLKDPDEQQISEIQDISIHEPLQRSESRVQSDFVMLESVGRGGFGEVHKVQNKLDGQWYALKKIKLNPENETLNGKLRREVEYLSQLNHENIVRYFNSWTEDVEDVLESDNDLSDLDEREAPCVQNANRFFYVESTSSGLDYYYGDYDITTSTDEASEANSEDRSVLSTKGDNMPLPELRPIKMLYIQMEFCESNTLQSAIDRGTLHDDVDRIWRYLREIVEGLVHIHGQGIIHRDLKPLNIFLNSNDHVKIGDFGLATTNRRYKKDVKNKNENELPITTSKVDSGSSTSRVGTALYKAPELNVSLICDEKLDMYSLGIILFEMCYKPPATGSERISVLTNLRSQEIVFPHDFLGFPNQKKIIRELLNHDPLQRPSSKDLLKFERIPPILEEEKQQNIIRHVIDNPQLKLFKYLMDCCFSKRQSVNTNSLIYRNISKFESVGEIVTSIFKKHGGLNLAMTTVVPQNGCISSCKHCIKLMTTSGSIVSKPCNSRRTFASYIALNRKITWLRRYSVEKAPKDVMSHLHEEAYEFVFDIITPINLCKPRNFLPDAEILQIIDEMRSSLALPPHSSVSLHVNHSLIIEAIFLECGISIPYYKSIVALVLTFVNEEQKNSHHAWIILNGYLSSDTSSKLIKLTEIACTINKADSILQHFSMPKAKDLAKQGLKELKCIVETAVILGVTCNVEIKPGLFNTFEQYSGMLVELTCNLKKKKYVLVTGGRYDRLIEQAQNPTADSQKSRLAKYGVGISVNLENLCEILEFGNVNKCPEIVVCSFNSNAVLNKKAEILRSLWSAGIRCSFIKASKMSHLKRFCKDFNIFYALIVKPKNITEGCVTIREWKNRWSTFTTTSVSIPDIVSTVKRLLLYQRQTVLLPIMEASDAESTLPIIFKTSEPLSLYLRIFWEVQIEGATLICRRRLRGNITIIATDIEMHIINDFAASVRFDFNYAQSRERFATKYPTQCSLLKMICQEVYQEKVKNGYVNLILYNLNEKKYFIHLL